MLFKLLGRLFSKKKAADEKNTSARRVQFLQSILKAIHNSTETRFMIINPKEHGFLIKVWGIFGYVAYSKMPWEGYNPEYWRAVGDKLKGKAFSGVIAKLNSNPLFIYVNAEGHNLLKPNLIIGNSYSGIIVSKKKYGLFIDIGIHFDWECGGILGLLHKSKLCDTNDINKFSVGDTITTIFCGFNELDQIVFCNNEQEADWLTKYPHSLIGKKVLVKVVKSGHGSTEFYALERFRSILLAPPEVFNENQRKYIRNRIKMLEDGDYIRCKIVEVNEKRKCLVIYWHIENEAPKEDALKILPEFREKMNMLTERFNTPHEKK